MVIPLIPALVMIAANVFLGFCFPILLGKNIATVMWVMLSVTVWRVLLDYTAQNLSLLSPIPWLVGAFIGASLMLTHCVMEKSKTRLAS